MKNIILFDFEKTHPIIDSPLEALLHSFVGNEEYLCTLYTTSEQMMNIAGNEGIHAIKVENFSYWNIQQLFHYIKLFRAKDTIIHTFGSIATEALLSFQYYFGTKTRHIASLTEVPSIDGLAKLQKLYTRVNRITSPTRQFSNTLSHILKYPLQNITVTSFGITPALYQREMLKRKERIVFTVVCALEEGNSIFELLEALSVLHKANMIHAWEIRFIGTGSLFQQIIEYATELGIVDNIALLGDFSLALVLPETTVLILPSFYWNISQAIYSASLLQIPLVHVTDANLTDILEYKQNNTYSFSGRETIEIRNTLKQALEMREAVQLTIHSLEETIAIYHSLYKELL